METISRMDFRAMVGWNCGNYPYSTSGLSYANGLSGAQIECAKINESHYNLYYKYDVLKDTIHFPIVITPYADDADKCFIAHSRLELVGFLENPTFDKPFAEKREIMIGSDYSAIRSHEISVWNRIPFTELYDWNKEEFYGYKYVEF